MNNTSKGGSARVVGLGDVDPAVLEIAVRAAAAMGRTDLSGVDVVVHEQTRVPYVLEVNVNPDIIVGAADQSDVAMKVAAVLEALEARAAARK